VVNTAAGCTPLREFSMPVPGQPAAAHPLIDNLDHPRDRRLICAAWSGLYAAG